MANAKIKAVLFDMDGVLIDAREWHYEALNKALSLFGMEISRYDHLVTYDGLPTRKKLEMLSKEKGLPLGLHGFLNQLKQLYTEELVYAKCKPNFKHQMALSKLKQQGYRLAVCSNSIRSSIELMMGKALLREHLEFILSNEDITLAKPNPEIYLTAMKKMGLKPAECLILEDNAHGIEAAKASGSFVMEVLNPADVYFDAIAQRISEIENGQALSAERSAR